MISSIQQFQTILKKYICKQSKKKKKLERFFLQFLQCFSFYTRQIAGHRLALQIPDEILNLKWGKVIESSITSSSGHTALFFAMQSIRGEIKPLNF